MTLQIGNRVLALFCALWAGIVIGVSFIATVAKFAAVSLTRPVALDVGAHTFAMLARIEWGLVIVLALLIFAARVTRVRLLLLGLVVAILLGEAIWLFPALNTRTALVIAGETLPPSPLHAISVAAESSKVILLALFAAIELKAIKIR
ncbi:MAG: hypothetical protein KF807_11515 [Xanthobacteraceae bacterium]|nr:hypothetical protein [Xanthobacteraceae bacterium]